MRIETFDLERTQSLWENLVEINLTESGVHPYTLDELLEPAEIDELRHIRLGYGQTNGSIELRDAIARLYPDTDRDNVLVTNGSAEANFIATFSLLEAGDEIVLMIPNYMQIWGIARAIGVKIRTFALNEEKSWAPTLDEIDSLVTPRTKAIVLCNPNNPTGAVLSPDDRRHLVDVAERVGAWIYCDEIYRGAELAGEETMSFQGDTDRAIVAGGLSKAYALPGLRVGWLAGPADTIAGAWATHDYTSIASGVLSNYVAARALEPERRMSILERNRGLLRRNLAVLEEWIAARPGVFEMVPPRAGGMAFMRYGIDINSTELTTRLRKERDVFIVAGDCFGMDRYVRIGIGGPEAHLREGLERFGTMLDELAGSTSRATAS